MAVRTQHRSPTAAASILLIENDSAARAEICDHLKPEIHDAAVRPVSRASEIDELPEDEVFELCIIGTGVGAEYPDAVGRLRRRQPDCPVLLMLELESEEMAAEADHRGVDGYIIKTPGYGRRLRVAVSKLIESTAKRNENIRSLETHARQFKELVENSAQGILIQVGDKPVYANAALAHILGYDDPQAVIDLESVEEMADARETQRLRKIARRRRAGLDAPESYVFRARRRDGTLIWLENRVNELDWQGHAALQSTMVDVSGRQRATNALRLAARVASRAGEQDDFEAAIRVALRRLGRGMGWDLAESWVPSADGVLEPGPVWCRGDRFKRFIQGSRQQRFGPGEGLPGRVWKQGALWLEDVPNTPGLFRRSILANAAGLRTGCGLPVVAHGRTVAVLCFFTSESRPRDRDLVTALSAGTASLGPVLFQIRSEQARRASTAPSEALISHHVDGLLVVDEQDCIVFANPAAEESFGRSFDELRGMPFSAPALENSVAEIEIRNVRTDTTRMKEMRVAGIDWNGRAARLISLRDVTERYEAQNELKRHRAALQERVKEMACLYTVSESLSRQDIGWREALQRVVDALPDGWLYPEVLRVRLRVEGIELTSEDFRETAWHMASDVRVDKETVGRLEVCYAEHKPDQDIGPFLQEERKLLDDIARRIGQTISIRRYQQELDASRGRFQDFAEAASDWLWEMDANLRFTYISERIEAVMGQPVDWWLGRSRLEVADERADDDEKWAIHRADLEARRPFKHFRYQVTLPDGRVRHVVVSGVPVFDDHGEFRGYRGSGADETEQVEAGQRALESDRRLQGIADGLPGIVFQRVRKPDGTIEYPYLSAGTYDMLGYAPEEFQQDPLLWSDLLHPEDRPRFDVAVAESGRTLEPMDTKFRMSMRSGDTRWVWHRSRPRRLENGDTVWDCIELDISEQKKAEARIQYLGYYDQLTGLPNTELFVERVSQILPIASRNQQTVAVAMLGLKRFKQVNEEFGMTGGDEVLRTAAERFRHCLRPGDTVARLGGDRFLVLLPSVGTDPRTHKPFDRLMQAMEHPFTIKHRQILVAFNMGVAIFPDHGDSAEELIQRADTAQAHFSRWGPGFGYTLYQHRMPESNTSRLALEKELRDAIESVDQLEPYFQPIYSLRSGRLVAVETLARWNHPERGLVPPGEFIELAEETGLIIPLGLKILRQACTHAQRWKLAGLSDVIVAVNLSAAQIRDPELANSIRSILRGTGMAADRLALEVTESTLITNLDQAIQFMEELVAEGVRFALDDFGVGYSSLSYLSRLPVQALKIDRSFVRDLGVDPRSGTTVRAIEALAHALDLHVAAEGIETQDQLDHVRRLGCDTLQGYLLGKPMPAAEMETVLEQGLLPTAITGRPGAASRA